MVFIKIVASELNIFRFIVLLLRTT